MTSGTGSPIAIMAASGDISEFSGHFAVGDEVAVFRGVPLIFLSLGNTDPGDRFTISSFLLDRGCTVGGRNSRGQTALHILFGQVRQDAAQMTVLCRRLIERGVDPAAEDASGVTATQELIGSKLGDDNLSDVFDVWFSQPSLSFDRPNKAGFSPLDLARKRPYRSEMVRRMNEYSNA